jgi:hypothetical protein
MGWNESTWEEVQVERKRALNLSTGSHQRSEVEERRSQQKGVRKRGQ